jgi:two-component system CheB/CheR fusion protein
MTDVSALKQKEEDLLGANLQLADADRRKDEYLAMLSHELRNPLAAIKNSLYIVERAPPGGDQAMQAQAVMERQIAQLERFVDDLLDVTRISHKKIQLKLERFDLNEVVQRTVEDYRALFEKSEVRLDATFAPEPVIVSADWARIAQVVGNLLTNAAKFTARRGITQVSVARDAKESQATIRVADTGTGLAPEILPGLFEPFTQADGTLDRSKGGLGLGLALVRGLVEAHGGDVTAHSAGPGQGAEFIVCLPFDVAATEPEPPEPAPPEPAPSAATRRTRILVIEDKVDAAEALRLVLELDDHEVEVAYDGSEGLEKARRFKPDIVFCDIGLPGMNGYEVARAFRSDETLKDAHLVALTGYGRPEDLERAAGAGFERHILKPASVEKIEQVVSEMSRSSTTDSSAGISPVAKADARAGS